jgi:hypothetical protein
MYGTAGQIQDSTLTYLTTVAGTNVITAVAPVLMSAYATGQTFYFLAAGGNTGAVTVNINAIGAKAVKKTDGSALISGDILTGAAVQIMYDGTNFQLLSDSNGTNKTVGNLTVTGTTTATGLITANGGVSGALNGSLGATTPSTAVVTSINKMAITAPATSSTLAVADGKTLTASNSLTLAGTDSTTQTFPTTSATIARTDAAQTFTGVQTFSSAPAGAGLSGLATYKVCATGSGSTTISIDLSTVLNADPGSWLISAQMGQGGATVDVTYSGLYLYSVAIIGQPPTLRTVLADDSPHNNNGNIAISGTTVVVSWGGSRGPAFVTAQRLY